MDNTIQLYVDKEKEIKGYPITSPDRVIDENGVNIKKYVKNAINDAKLEGGNIDDSVFESLTLGIHTDGLIYLFKNGEPIGSGVAQSTTILPDGDVVGYVDSRNNIVLNGSLPIGLYTVKYEMDDGTLIDVGTIDKTTTDSNFMFFTNLLPSATDADFTTPYNGGKGYKTNLRWSLSGKAEKDAVGQCLSGYFRYYGEILRVANVVVTGTESPYIVYFDQNGTVIDGVAPVVCTGTDKNGTLIFRRDMNGYIRLCLGTISDDTIVTFDEPIYKNESEYTNVLKNAIDKDGSLFNNGKGYVNNRRYSNSSNSWIDQQGISATGFIPCTKNDLICVKNINYDSNSVLYSGVKFYDANFNEILGTYINAHFSPKYKGVFVAKYTPRYYTAMANVGETDTIYLMITSSKIDDSTVVTLNELPIGTETGSGPGNTNTFTNIIDIVGYMDNTRISTSTVGTTKSETGHVCTNLIDIVTMPNPLTVRTKGVNFNHEQAAVNVYTTDGIPKYAFLTSHLLAGNYLPITAAVDDEGNLTMTITKNSEIGYIQLSGYGIGANLIVTLDELIP